MCVFQRWANNKYRSEEEEEDEEEGNEGQVSETTGSLQSPATLWVFFGFYFSLLPPFIQTSLHFFF